MGGYDDELTQPLEGALEATTSEGPTSPAVGRDEWVARHGDNRARRGGPLGTIEERLAARSVVGLARRSSSRCRCLVPVVSDSGYVRRVAFDIVLYMLLALGLNVVVGWGGLLDLGYVAFYGIGAYAYAMLELRPLRHPPADARLDPARRRDRRASSASSSACRRDGSPATTSRS